MNRSQSSIAFTIAAIGIAVYSGMDAAMKGLSIASGAYSAVLWRSIVGAVLTGTIFVARGTSWPERDALRLHITRGLAAGISVLLFFWGLVRVPLAQGVALTFLAPLIALYLAAAMLGERIRRAAILGSVIACIGVCVIALGQARADPSASSLYGSGAIILASILYAWSLILLRQQAQLADPIEVTLFTSLVIGVALLFGAPWFASLPAATQLPMIGLAAVLGSFSAAMLAWAYGRAEAQVLAPVEYTAFVWSALFGWLIFREPVSLYTVTGAGLIIAGCLAAIRGTAAPAPQTEAAA
ncbi:DMT family transporter [Sphingomonas oligophenolica]|uniref:DMT family transporter n=1 Tax=Sphingomonas oligophenolica TaxID=301154 RepID=A0ABU9Y5G6_9SPHN